MFVEVACETFRAGRRFWVPRTEIRGRDGRSGWTPESLAKKAVEPQEKPWPYGVRLVLMAGRNTSVTRLNATNLAEARQDDGSLHNKIFTSLATVRVKGFEFARAAQAHQKKRAEQHAAVLLLAAISRVDPPVLEEPAYTKTEPGKDVFSLLHEWTQEAQSYEFELSGPAHAPVVTCHGKAGNHAVTSRASSKRDAKWLAAKELLARITEHEPKEEMT